MKWRDKLQMFVLTKQEQRTIAFVVLMLVLGLLTKHYRAHHAPPASSPNEHVQPSPSVQASPRSG
ncbi:MAG: hypothetical protein H0X34_00560 [Chthoniobacterales bacterium]|nr:hypothetical protein [Chthoniobacterales bacterium]